MPAPDQQGRLSTAREGQAGAPDFVGVGAHVASLLAAAEQAASQILREANDEAEAIRADARGEAARVRDQAVSALRDAQRQRADIEKLVHDVRGAADAYAEERRREADDEAAKAHDRLRELGSMARKFADEIDQSLAPREQSADTAEETLDEALTLPAAKAAPKSGDGRKRAKLGSSRAPAPNR